MQQQQQLPMQVVAPNSAAKKGVKGVRLKHFEQVLASILPVIQPAYVKLPPIPPLYGCNDDDNDDHDTDDDDDEGRLQCWPYDRLPAAARVLGSLAGQLAHPARAARKEEQIRSMLRCILPLIPPVHAAAVVAATTTTTTSYDDTTTTDKSSPYTIVDFGGGSGHLSIPLALLLPACTIVCVDLGGRSLELLHAKAAQCVKENELSSSQQQFISDKAVHHQRQSCCYRRPTAIPNLFTCHGAAEAWNCQTFDMAVALHLCGEATDVVLRLAGRASASAIVAAPCCVGKLQSNTSTRNPYIYQATGSNTPTVAYPQSRQFCELIGGGQQQHQQQDDSTTNNSNNSNWNALAKAADYSDTAECRTSRNAARRTAKALLETDRRLYLQETFGYATALTRMEPWEATPKNDILVAWRVAQKHMANCSDDFALPPPIATTIDTDCQADIQLTVDHLLVVEQSSPATNDSTSSLSCAVVERNNDRVDWTGQEEAEIRQQLLAFFAAAADASNDDAVLVFPTRMGGRTRKLVHGVAEQMGLAHWCQGRKYADKTVAVARKGRLRPPPPPAEAVAVAAAAEVVS